MSDTSKAAPAFDIDELVQDRFNDGLQWLVERMVKKSFDKHLQEVERQEKQTLDYLRQETAKLCKLAQQLDKYITVGGELKDGKTVGKS